MEAWRKMNDLTFWQKIYLKLRKFWAKYNPFDLDCEFSEINKHITDVYEKVIKIEQAVLDELEDHRKKTIYYSLLIETVGEVSPDMLWAKDLQGKYLYANNATKNGLLLDHNPFGKTDIQLAQAAKKRYGDENHTFGEMCVNSDYITLMENQEKTFWEHGKVKGKDLHLFVKKKPLVIDGVTYGTVGSGRDITELVELTDDIKNQCPSCQSFMGALEKYKYKG